MNLRYVLADPTKNVTALIKTPVAPALRRRAADAILRAEPACEQVGFVFRDENGAPCLRMTGGEFCGNASISAAALYCAEEGLPPGETRALSLDVSGARGPVRVRVTANGKNAFACEIRMPLPLRISEERLTLNGREFRLPVVYFPGIAHCIAPEALFTPAEAELAVRQWCAHLGTRGFGLMLTDGRSLSLRPLVYIPAADTLFWERSCASGTCAVGACVSRAREKTVDLTVNQPGGTLRIRASADALLLSGGVTLAEEKQIVL